MRLRQVKLITGIAALSVICAVQASEPTKPYTFFTVDIPGSLSTTIFGINSNRDIVGAFETPFPPEFGLQPELRWNHGFVLRDGVLTTIDAPQSILTQIRGINNQGDIVGAYIPIQNAGTPGGGFRGLLIKNGGEQTTVDFKPTHLNTVLMRITSNGTMVGCYHDDGIDSGPQDSMHGISFDSKGIMTSIDDEVPGVQFGSGMHTGISDDGKKKSGFLFDHSPSFERSRGYSIEDGKFSFFDVPGSKYTQGWDINPSGDIVGFYGDGDVVADSNLHATAFLKIKDTYQAVQYPKAMDTRAFGINSARDIVGTYETEDGHTHGFVAILQPYIGSVSANTASALKLPARVQSAAAVQAHLSPIDNSASLAKSDGQAPACHRTVTATVATKRKAID